jgi:hypothetical protein
MTASGDPGASQRVELAERDCDAPERVARDGRAGTASLAAAIRAFGVTSGGPTVGAVAVLASMWSAGRGMQRRRRVPRLAALGMVAGIGYLTVLRPWSRRWGTTADEATRVCPATSWSLSPGSR